jgi:hypothetical protein
MKGGLSRGGGQRRRRYRVNISLDAAVRDRAITAAERAQLPLFEWVERAVFLVSWDKMRAEHRQICAERREGVRDG